MRPIELDGLAVVKLALSLVLVSCASENPSYPGAKCADVVEAPKDASSYVIDDWRESLFADERAAWVSNACDALRSRLPPLDDAHDLEDETLVKECDDASLPMCRAGCVAQRRHDGAIAAWTRALRGVASFAPSRVDFAKLVKSCALAANDARRLWACAHLPLPPKRFRLEWVNRIEYVHNGNITSTRIIGFDAMRATAELGLRRRTLDFEECGGSGSRWATFLWDAP